MAAVTVPYMSVEEYLHAVYQPDREYVDGVVEERALGEFDHGDLQMVLGRMLGNREDEWGIRVVVETRVQVSAHNYRVPDVCVMPLAWRRTQIIRDPPMLCLEVLSPEDRMSRVLRRCREFLTMGVRELWIFDPAREPAERVAYRLTAEGMTEHRAGVLRLEGTPVEIDILRAFAALDR